MGIQISEIVSKKEIELSDLRGKTIAIDAFNAIYQFLSTIRQLDGTPLQDREGRITSHLSGLFYRNINLLLEGIKLVYVFDGKAPEMKFKERKRREELKEIAREKYEKAKSREDIAGMRKYSQQFVKIDDEIVNESKELLEAMGIPVVQAVGEGEAEATALARADKVWAAASQDYDVLMYGAPKLIRNLTLAKRRRTSSGQYIDIHIELIEFEDVLNKLGINQDQLICLGILVGTDYNPGGVKGIGQKNALKIVQKYQYPVRIFEYIEKSEKYELDFDWQMIYEHFKKYKCCSNEEIKFKKVDEERVKEILLGRDFSESRIDSGLGRLREAEEKGKQRGLGDFT